MCLALATESIQPSHSICASSPRPPAPYNLHYDVTHWCIERISLRASSLPCLPICAIHPSASQCAMRAARDVRLGELRLPLIKKKKKILICEKEGCIQRHQHMHTLTQAGTVPSHWLHNHATRAKSRLAATRIVVDPYLHFV